ncbi:MAG: YceI family protein [bacterium]|nr:YceI family protein [bacterium]
MYPNITTPLRKIISAGVIASLIAFTAYCGGEQSSQSAAPAGQAADIGQADAVYSADAGASSITWKGSKLYESDIHTGTIALESGKLGFKDGAPVAGSFTIDMTSIQNTDIENAEYNAKLVGHLKNEDFFDVEKFPTAKFEIVSVSPGSAANEYNITGNLTIKSITKSISGTATIANNADGAEANAKLIFDRTQFNVQYGSESTFADLAKDKVIDDKIEIAMKIALAK